MVKAIGQM